MEDEGRQWTRLRLGDGCVVWVRCGFGFGVGAGTFRCVCSVVVDREKYRGRVFAFDPSTKSLQCHAVRYHICNNLPLCSTGDVQESAVIIDERSRTLYLSTFCRVGSRCIIGSRLPRCICLLPSSFKGRDEARMLYAAINCPGYVVLPAPHIQYPSDLCSSMAPLSALGKRTAQTRRIELGATVAQSPFNSDSSPYPMEARRILTHV